MSEEKTVKNEIKEKCSSLIENVEKTHFFYKFCFYGTFFFIPYGIYNLLVSKPIEGIYELAYGLFLLYLSYKLKKQPEITWLINLTLLLLLPFFYIMLKFGGISSLGFIWMYQFPLLAFFTRGKKGGMLLLAIFYFFYILLIILNSLGFIVLAFSSTILIINLTNLILLTIFTYIYETNIEKSSQKNCFSNLELKEATKELKQEISNRQKAETKTKEIFQELEKKNKFSQDTKKAMINLLEDISEERKISMSRADDLQKFKLAVENASDQIVITDKDKKIIYANSATETNTGFKKEELIGETPAIWGRQMPDKFYKNMYKTIKKYKTVFTDDFTNLRKNGEKYIAHVYISPILDENNNVKYYVGIERDITREKEVDKAKTEFVSLASHQLRTPLSAINWYTEMILNGDAGKVTKEQKNYLMEIFNGSHKMSDLVNALLNVSRIELGTFVINPKKINIIDTINDVIKEMTPLIEKKQVKIVEKFPKGKLMLSVDPNLIRIIFQNLISNAIKYNKEKGKVTIEINKQKKYINFKISDTGYGIPKDQQSKIFQKLFRAKNIKQKDTEGTGLGLYIVKSIIQQSGGMVWFKSIEDKGTTFYIAIPAKGMKKKTGEKALS